MLFVPKTPVQLCSCTVEQSALCVLALICCYLVLLSLNCLLRQNAGNPILAVPKFFSCDYKSMMVFHRDVRRCCHEHQYKSPESHGLVVRAVTYRAKGHGSIPALSKCFVSHRV